MGKILKKLVKHGVDIDEALGRFAGDEDTYLECFDLLMKESKFYELGECIKNEEYDRSFILAITLKGIVGNLGITDLFEHINAIVGSLSIYDYSDLPKLYDVMIQEFECIRKLK